MDNISIIFLTAQVVGFISFLFSMRAYFQNQKNGYAFDSMIANILNIIHYIMIGGYAATVTKAIAAVREIFVFSKRKNNIFNYLIYVFFIIIYLTCMVFLFNGSIVSLFPIIAAIIYFTFEWFGSITSIRIIGLISSFLWLLYNISVFSISGICQNVVSSIMIIISIIKGK